MARYLVQTTEVYRVSNENEAEAFIAELKSDKRFELAKYSAEKKVAKEKGEIVDEWVRLTAVKKFNNEKEPDSEIDVAYDIVNEFGGWSGPTPMEE